MALVGDPVQYAPGQVLPGTVYRVVRHLATGGMGSVYDVEDTTVEKRYVLKTLHPQLVSRDDLARRMRDEAKALAKLNHPNIVDVITAGVTTDAVRMPFYVMERLNGQNLRVVIEKKGSLDITHCLRIAIDVADALEHAHENNIVHRDVKPENIFLHRNANGTTTTKLLDFGIVRLLDRKMSHTHGKFIGTLRYASPEQIMGEKLGPGTDIYSLGVVLYEMITGRGPFDEYGDAYGIGAAHAQQPAPPVSLFSRSVPPALERLVMQTLAKSPNDRPRDCFTLASELRRVLREVEAAGPRSATAVNVITSAGVPDTRKQSPSPVPQVSVTAATEHGMIPPSVVAGDTLHNAGSGVRGAEAIAPTVAAGQAPPRAGIDREAATRASAPYGSTQRMAQNDTRMEHEDDVVRAAFGERAPLVVPPAYLPEDRGPSVHPSGELVFPPAFGAASATGPLAGEARTRPPEKAIFLPLVVAAAVSVAVIGGALILVSKPWTRHGPDPSSEARTAQASPQPLPPPSTSPAPPIATPAPSASSDAPPTAPAPAASAGRLGAHASAKPEVSGAAHRGAKPAPAAPPTSPATPAGPARESKEKPDKVLKPEDISF
jgi:eukaryotic-like serine/threonine-protein kinase